jgi:hypothetical protein
MVRLAANSTGSHATGDHRRFNATNVDVGQRPIARQIEIVEFGIS